MVVGSLSPPSGSQGLNLSHRVLSEELGVRRSLTSRHLESWAHKADEGGKLPASSSPSRTETKAQQLREARPAFPPASRPGPLAGGPV